MCMKIRTRRTTTVLTTLVLRILSRHTNRHLTQWTNRRILRPAANPTIHRRTADHIRRKRTSSTRHRPTICIHRAHTQHTHTTRTTPTITIHLHRHTPDQPTTRGKLPPVTATRKSITSISPNTARTPTRSTKCRPALL